MSVSIQEVTVEHHESGFGIEKARPRLSWRFAESSLKDWKQSSYEIAIARGGTEETFKVDSNASVLVPWPAGPLRSRERVQVRVRASGQKTSTPWASVTVEAALLDQSEWEANMITGLKATPEETKPPFRLSKTFKIAKIPEYARLRATAHGLYEVEINGKRVGDQCLSPGWTSYKHQLNYQTYDISQYLVQGDNVAVAHVGEGWYSGLLGWSGRNIFGDTLGFSAQLELDDQLVVTDDTWDVLASPILSSEIYNGEAFDSNPVTDKPLAKATVKPFGNARLISSEAPPVRRVMEVNAKEIIITPQGKTVLDFGQNLVGWVRIERDFEGSGDILLRHAEVMENGELGTRPLRRAKAQALIKLGGRTKGWEPKFTFFGFRYVEVSGVKDISLQDFTAIVVSSDMRRTGHFSCSHSMISKLHENTVWGMRSNFVSLPTDCPQRDERLGWTGDIQVFAPSANFLFDTSGFLNGWLDDLAVEQAQYGGVPPNFVPWLPPPGDSSAKPRAHAAWADVAVITPWDLYQSFGDSRILDKQFASMTSWLDQGVPRNAKGLWSSEPSQYGDWLDPKAPPQFPAHGRTDFVLVADAYLVYVTGLVSKIAAVLGKDTEMKRYKTEFQRLRQLFRDEYITKSGRVTSDTQTALVLALWFDLVDEDQRDHAIERLEWLIRWDYFKISTGFAGTPLILPCLARNGQLHLAYRMLQEQDNPSWLYSVGMGATTIWERWDSMLEDGSINPGQMTSFNHYALGSVVAFMHNTIGGLAPLTAGWETALIKPQPGGTVTSADVSFDSPYGLYAVKWDLHDEQLRVRITVPPNGSAQVVLPGIDEVVGSGQRQYEAVWKKDERFPPKPLPGPQSILMPDRFVA